MNSLRTLWLRRLPATPEGCRPIAVTSESTCPPPRRGTADPGPSGPWGRMADTLKGASVKLWADIVEGIGISISIERVPVSYHAWTGRLKMVICFACDTG